MGATRHGHAASAAARPAETPAADGPVDAKPVTEIRPAEAPVFVDSTGRRRRLIRRTTFGFLVGACAYGALIIVSLLGGPVPPNALLPLPGGQHGPISAGQATSTPHPAGTAAARASAATAGAAAPGAGATAAPARAAASPTAAPAASLSPSPTASRRQPPGLVGKSASPGATGHGH